MAKIKIGYAPTRRSIFSAPDAVKYRGLTADRLRELGIDFVDITDVNEEGLLYDDQMRTAFVFVTPSADFLQQVKYLEDSVFHLLI